jgi:hypothetical protein
LIDGKRVSLPDPSGGEFNAAGNFDRVLPMENQLPIDQFPELPVLSRVEAYADVEFTPDDMTAIAQEVARLLPFAKPGPETRGLERLRTLAEHGARTRGAVLRAHGD